jgi:uncharacterized protein YaiI (UPF0178 family)
VTEIYVDADACPVKSEILRVATRHVTPVHMVSNSWMRLEESPLIHRVVVSDGFDAADDWIAEHIGMGDVAITSDIPLADRCLKQGASVMGPTGKPFTSDNIGPALATRDFQKKIARIFCKSWRWRCSASSEGKLIARVNLTAPTAPLQRSTVRYR